MHSGEPSVHFINSVLVTVVVALFVLWRYRQAILGGMMQGEPLALPLPGLDSPQLAKAAASDPAAREAFMRRRIAAAYLLTTALCSPVPITPIAEIIATRTGTKRPNIRS